VKKLDVIAQNQNHFRNQGVEIVQKLSILCQHRNQCRLVLLATARTFGCSTALCESTFSVLTRIDRPQRLSMTHQRLANLVFLGFEKERTNNVDFQKVLRKFNEMKNRRLQLF
jgi:hypothetical protein